MSRQAGFDASRLIAATGALSIATAEQTTDALSARAPQLHRMMALAA